MKYIEIVGAKQNNLKSLDLKIPFGSFVVVCGPSGSGKSSLAFETLFAEGQRHYTQTLSNYARQYIQELPKPLVQYINNIPPSLALEQKNSVRSSRPTVATLTELDDFLCLLFTHLGEVFCPEHDQALRSYSPDQGAEKIQEMFPNGRGIICVPVSASGCSSLTFKKKLIQQGFHRVAWKKGKKERTGSVFPMIYDLNSSVKIPVDREIYIVLDRLAFKDRARLTDSLKLAYKIFLQYSYRSQKAGQAVVFSTDNNKGLILSEAPSCPHCAYQFPYSLQTSLFNFNSSLGACPSCRGFGNSLTLDEEKIVPQPEKSLMEGALVPFAMPSTAAEFRSLQQFCLNQNIDLHCPWKNLPARHKKKIWRGSAQFVGVQGFFDYLESKKYKIHVRIFLARYKSPVPCRECKGTRLRKEVSYVMFRNTRLPEMLSMDIGSLRNFFQDLRLRSFEKKKGGEVVRKIRFILDGLSHIGLEYLQLNRPVKTLSSGEFQRLNLIHQLGLGLSQVLYVLDEPTLGLHSRDSLRLIELLEKLKSEGNTLVIVEHDPDMIRRAEFIVEMGPGSGLKGGKVVFAGEKEKFLKCSSLTRFYLAKKKTSVNDNPWALPVDPENCRYFLEVSGCRAHNLKNISLRVPLNRLVTVTGVSGSGKSTLVSQTLYPALAGFFGVKGIKGHPYEKLTGVQHLQQVVWINSSPVEKTKRSLPVTYLKIYDQIRNLMATRCRQQKIFIKPGFFSLNVEGGRCPLCRGLGYQEVEMVFMDPVRIPCEECKGKRFKPEILNLKWRHKNIHQILNMTVAEAAEFFVSYPSIWKPLSLLKRVGLDYLILGQDLSTLSGGEAQRLKLARALLNSKKNALYILDEPTLGLHFKEVELLLRLLRDLIKKGGSVLLIEHNMELIRQSDYLIDMGPGAGPKGGQIVIQGSPASLAENPIGFTAELLRENEKTK